MRVLTKIIRSIFKLLEYLPFGNGFFNPMDPPNAAVSKEKSAIQRVFTWNGFRPTTIELRGKLYYQLETTPMRILRASVLELINSLTARQFSHQDIK